jgi:glutamine cyclotransferase
LVIVKLIELCNMLGFRLPIVGMVVGILLSPGIASAQADKEFREFVEQAKLPIYELEVVGQIPHSTESYIQGLVFLDGLLYESTGLYDESSLQKIDAKTGEVLKVVPIDSWMFAEGLALCGGRLVQLTWKEGTAIIYSLDNLSRVGEFEYNTDGWGLAWDGERFLMSDGSPELYFRRSSDFALVGGVQVTIEGRLLYGLNELEYVGGRLYGNLLGGDYIVEIDPVDGRVMAVVDAKLLRNLMPPQPPEHLMNGIAHDPETNEFFLTGKNWPTIFRVRLVRQLSGR